MVTWVALLAAALAGSLWSLASAGSLLPIAGEPPPSLHLLHFPQVPHRSRRSAQPSTSDSTEDAQSQWRPQSAAKPQFVTKRGQDVPPYSARNIPDDAVSPRFNEIPLPERGGPPAAYPSRYEATAYRDAGYPQRPLQRRVIYYADLPEIPRPRARAYADPRSYSSRDYDPYGPGSSAQNKYIRDGYARDGYVRDGYVRDGRLDDRQPYSNYGRDDWYRYRAAAPPPPPPSPGSYAIIDADRVQPSRQDYVQSRPYPGPDPSSRYYRVPAPYQRTAGPPPPLAPSAPPYDQYRRQPPSVPARISVGNNRFSEPYRDYNPHQAAPWSMQIGTKLTVKDENRDKQYGPGRRFYVQSQDQGPYRPPSARYDRVEDDPRHRL